MRQSQQVIPRKIRNGELLYKTKFSKIRLTNLEWFCIINECVDRSLLC